MPFQQQVLARAVWGPLAWAGLKAGATRAAARRQVDVSRRNFFFLSAATWCDLVLPIFEFSSNPTP
ncbi:unnamed protein product [Prunus armeniaca]